MADKQCCSAFCNYQVHGKIMNTLNETLAELCKSMDICYVATCAFDTAHLPTLPQDTLQQSLPYSAK